MEEEAIAGGQWNRVKDCEKRFLPFARKFRFVKIEFETGDKTRNIRIKHYERSRFFILFAEKNSMMILIVGSDVLFNHAERTKRYCATY